MSSSEIKQVISTLCKQLNILLHVSLKPEYFRLAKFDKNDDNIGILRGSHILENFKPPNNPKNNIDVDAIKKYMESINYTSAYIYQLPEDFSSGSRELLLAIAFLVAKNLKNLIKEEIDKSPFGISFCLLDMEDLQTVIAPEPSVITNKREYDQFILWMKGRVQQNRKMCTEYETQISKMCCKLTTSSLIRSSDPLCEVPLSTSGLESPVYPVRQKPHQAPSAMSLI
ncbi:hypothetical protein NQ317_009472 [Molorchus minor]|uniref:Tubulin epsilon and delta complex protein 1 domain-containing protein n=1 Tax=Molorchus minor TaxID=1323400 RepID=A0ABQ9J7C2_9CUCU|nr:hypothetical protein NQ317_009472 [Molorchus minor]